MGCQIWDGFRDLEIEMEVEGGDGVYPPTVAPSEFDGRISFVEYSVWERGEGAAGKGPVVVLSSTYLLTG